jgi:pyruvate dehydrogenase E2 component (dihydrolipoamide acetyltransferase)
MQMERGIVLEWHVNEGDAVDEGDTLAEIESEKAVDEVRAQEAGVIRHILVPEGGEVPPGAPLAIVAGADEDISALESEAKEAGADIDDDAGEADVKESDPSTDTEGVETNNTDTAGAAAVDLTPEARKRAREVGVDLESVQGTGPKGSITTADIERAGNGQTASVQSAGANANASSSPRPPAQTGPPMDVIDGDPVGRQGEDGRNAASPRARALAEATGVELSRVSGSGPKGTILAEDVQAATSQQPRQVPGTKTLTATKERELSGMRQTIADRLSQSAREVPHVTEHREVNVEALLDATEVADEALDIDISLVDLVLAALSETLAAHPEFNARFEDGIHRVYREQNVGMAVDIEAGLITPVISNLQAGSLADIARRRQEMTEKALSGEYTMDDLSDGTFTVTNLGVFGVDSFTPIINPPEVAILALNSVRERAVRGDKDEVEFHRFMTFSLSFDHRVVDGADAAQFLQTLAENVENAHALLLERGK